MASGGWWHLQAWAVAAGTGPRIRASDLPHWLPITPGFHLAWDFDTNTQNIPFCVEAAAKGWVGFGFTPRGGMDRADMMTAWIRDGKPYFHDGFGVGTEVPVIDSSQDCTLLSLTQKGTHTFLKFRRPFRTCDPQDMDITADSMRLIYACSDSVPQGPKQMPVHETVSGVVSVQILSYGRKTVPIVNNSSTLDIVTNEPSRSDDGQYRVLHPRSWNADQAADMEAKVRDASQSLFIVAATDVRGGQVTMPEIPEEQTSPCVRMLDARGSIRIGPPVALLLTALMSWACCGGG